MSANSLDQALVGGVIDPRGDLPEDRHLWLLVLKGARPDADLYGRLHYARCCGGRLLLEAGRLRLDRGADDPDWDQEVREKALIPAADRIIALFARVEQEVAHLASR